MRTGYARIIVASVVAVRQGDGDGGHLADTFLMVSRKVARGVIIWVLTPVLFILSRAVIRRNKRGLRKMPRWFIVCG